MNRLQNIDGAAIMRNLARYRPFIALVAAVWLVVTLAPGEPAATGVGTDETTEYVAPEEDTAPVDAGTPVDAAAPAPTGDTTAPTFSSSSGPVVQPRAGAPRAAGRAAAPPGVALVANCDPNTGRIKIPSRFAPLCTRASVPDNGGVTWQGITRDKIKLTYYLAQPDPTSSAILAAAGADDSEEEIRQQVTDFVNMYSAHFNLWGRKIDLVFVNGSGEATDDAAGKADAIKIATEIKAFANINAPNNTFVDELVARKVMCFCTTSLPIEFYTKRAPYVWSTLMASTQAYVHRAEYIGKRINGKNAKWAGSPAFQQQKRAFGLLYYETEDLSYKPGIDFFVKELREKYGITLKSIAAYNGYPDVAATQQQARPLIQKMVADGVNSIIFAGDPFGPIFFTQEATRQQYFPEWIITGSALTDTTLFGRLYDQNQWNHAFGISLLTARMPEPLQESYRFYNWHYGRAPVADTHAVIRSPLDIFFNGVHLSGGPLTPSTFRDAMFSMPINGTGGITTAAVGWGRKGIWPWDDYLAADDVTELWWDPNSTGQDDLGNQGRGMYRYVDMGKRYLPTQHPSTDPKAFDPANTVMVYDQPPPSDKWPEYPPPKRG